MSVQIHKKYQYKITNYEAVNENIIKINTALNNKPATIWGVYAISNNELCTTNHKFFEKVNNRLMKIGNSRKIIILGDLNSRTGRTDSKVVGLHAEISQNDNRERLIEMCEYHKLKITYSFFKHNKIHTNTWIKITRNLQSIL